MSPAETSILGDLVAAGVSTSILAGYHGWLRWRLRRNPAYTVQSVHALVRTAWVESIMTNRRDILAIQTLRNSTMAATFLASTAILLIGAVLSLSGQGDKLELTWNALDSFQAIDPSIWLLKLLALILDLSVAFFSFALAIRNFHHVGYLLNVPPEGRHSKVTPAYVAAYLNQAGRSYTRGMRAYYFLLPLLFWLLGPVLMVVASAALVVILHRLDRAGDEMEPEVKAVEEGRVPRLQVDPVRPESARPLYGLEASTPRGVVGAT